MVEAAAAVGDRAFSHAIRMANDRDAVNAVRVHEHALIVGMLLLTKNGVAFLATLGREGWSWRIGWRANVNDLQYNAEVQNWRATIEDLKFNDGFSILGFHRH